MKQTYGIDVKLVFIEHANRKVCIPIKNISGHSAFGFSKLNSSKYLEPKSR